MPVSQAKALTANNAFVQQQYAFAAHIRDPASHPCPADVVDAHMAVYRELFYSNIEDFLANTFPVLRQITADAAWHALVRDFYRRHRAQSPLFLEMPREFLCYLETERGALPDDSPFLAELAHYEWVELALTIDEQALDFSGVDPDGDLLAGRPALSPLAWSLSYRYPVHRIGPALRTAAAQPTFLLAYRDRRDDVGFMELNPVSASLLAQLRDDNRATGRDMLERIAAQMQHPDPSVVIEGGLAILQAMRARDIVLGTYHY